MEKRAIATSNAPAAVGPYSQGVRAAGLVFTAGQLGIVPGTKDFVGPGIEAQTRQAMENLKAVLEAGRSCLEHAVKVTVFLADMSEFAQMNSVYAEFFPSSPPARSAVQAAALPLGGRVEIEAIALMCDCDGGADHCSCND
jgi:2-iminobutanoate/2-iminopropanoate deaminase